MTSSPTPRSDSRRLTQGIERSPLESISEGRKGRTRSTTLTGDGIEEARCFAEEFDASLAMRRVRIELCAGLQNMDRIERGSFKLGAPKRHHSWGYRTGVVKW